MGESVVTMDYQSLDGETRLPSMPLLHGGDAHEEHRVSTLPPTDVLTGLSSMEAARRVEQFGLNEIPKKDVSLILLFLSQFVGVMPFILEICVIVSFAATNDLPDGILISMMVIANGLIGFHESHKALAALNSLNDSVESECVILRDGKANKHPTKDCVPGDIVQVCGGDKTPADGTWLERDGSGTVEIDTAPLTGEALPRKYPSATYGTEISSGCVCTKGECWIQVTATGTQTEIGQIAMDLQDGAVAQVSQFEAQIYMIVNTIIISSLLIAAAVFVRVSVFEANLHPYNSWDGAARLSGVKAGVSLIIAAVPVALPLIIQVTMAIGGVIMCDHKAIVTHISAMQDLAGMTVLGSDKTGTLTTANMRIIQSSIWLAEGFTAEELITFSVVASNRAALENPIDAACVASYDELYGSNGMETSFKKQAGGFIQYNATTKRATAQGTMADGRSFKVAKGYLPKVMQCDRVAQGQEDEDEAEEEQIKWVIENVEAVRPVVEAQDEQMGTSGYKTIGVSVQVADGPWKFVGIIPILDPPRKDTAETIWKIRDANVDVKMITGDHLNIAKETAKMIHLGVNIFSAKRLETTDTHAKDEMIALAEGFAGVKPQQKKEVILSLRKSGAIVGMTGDGVNDAPALLAAQVGIAVNGALDAARDAADIILTDDGLSAIFVAIVESRKIFRRLKSYIIYRVAATLQIVIVYGVLVLVSNCTITSVFIVMLALVNDLTMTPISTDHALASKKPERPTIRGIVTLASLVGVIIAISSVVFYYVLPDILERPLSWDGAYKYRPSGQTDDTGVSGVHIDKCHVGDCICDAENNHYVSAAMYLQLSVIAEFLIFSVRCPSFIWRYLAPHWLPVVFIFASNIVVSILAATGVILFTFNTTTDDNSSWVLSYGSRNSISYECFNTHVGNISSPITLDQAAATCGFAEDDPQKLSWTTIGIIWAWDIATLLIADLVKVWYLSVFEQDTEVIDMDSQPPSEAELVNGAHESRISRMSRVTNTVDNSLGAMPRSSTATRGTRSSLIGGSVASRGAGTSFMAMASNLRVSLSQRATIGSLNSTAPGAFSSKGARRSVAQ